MIVDIVVIAVLLISAVIAFLRGFIREVLTILGVFGGLVAAYAGGPFFSVYVRGWLGVEEAAEEPEKLFGIIPHTLVADVLAYGGIFIVVVIALSILSHFLAETVKSMGLGAIDRTFGVVFGIVRGVVLLALLYLPVHLLVDDEIKDTWFEGSKTYFYLEQSSATLSGLLPESTVAKLHEDTKKLEEALTAREKLQEIDVLRKEEGEDEKNDGYSDEFRGKMDELFDEKSRQPNE